MNAKNAASAALAAVLCMSVAARVLRAPSALPADAVPPTERAEDGPEPALIGPLPRPRDAILEDATSPAERCVGMLQMPDGSLLPPLNGVAAPQRPVWPEETPFSPVVGKERDPNGLEWYVHADGSRTTTVADRDPEGRERAWTIVANPTPVLPVDPR